MPAPILRLSGPLNATPAQRRAALEGRCCSQSELDEELNRMAPGPSFASAARSSAVVPRPPPSGRAEGAPSSDGPLHPALPPPPVQSFGSSELRALPSFPADVDFLWGAFSEKAHPADWQTPSLRWGSRQPVVCGLFPWNGTGACACFTNSLSTAPGRPRPGGSLLSFDGRPPRVASAPAVYAASCHAPVVVVRPWV